ncbi:MAG: Hsp20/alpha crystallin family protein [Phycisphaerae bacterium]
MVPSLWNRAHPLSRLRDDMDRLFDRMLLDYPRVQRDWLSSSAFPAVNIWQDATNLYAEAELPGIQMNDVEVSVVGNELTIKGERKPAADDNVTYHRRERGTGRFSRVFHLGIDVDTERVEASLRNGVLQVTLPKDERAMPRKIQVKSLPK